MYAKGFVVDKRSTYTEVDVRNPWDSTRILDRYILVDKNRKLPADLPDGKLIRTPLTRIGVSSTVQCSNLQAIGSLNIIKGVCEPSYIDIDSVTQGVQSGTIVDLGQANNINLEKVMMLKPELIFVTPIEGMAYGGIEKTGITMIETPDYMEVTPLARAEWIRFYGLFTGKEILADSLFKATADNYNRLKEAIAKTIDRPSVLLDTKFGNTWYTAGGRSYIVNLLRDAGANFIFADNTKTGAYPLSFEVVLDKSQKADFWLIKYNSEVDLTYNRLANEYESYTLFDAFRKKNIYECNTKKNHFYEDLPIHPDWILKDYANIFHPQLDSTYCPKYYKKMKD